MAIFPELEPATRSYDLGAFPLTEEPSFSAGPVRFRHATTPTDYRLNLEYVYLTDAQATQIRTHFQSQGGTYRSFQLPSIIWKGHTFSGDVFPVGTRWRYAEAPEETHHETGRYSITVSLVSDGTYEGSQVKPVGITFTGGAGFSSDRLVTGYSLFVTASFAGGEPYGDVIFAKDFLINKVTTILHFNGANGSTVKTDSSFYANTVVDDSPGADSIISTAQSKFGGASLYMDGTTSLIIDNPAISIGATEDHTVEFWFYPPAPPTAPEGSRALLSLRGSDTTTPSLNLRVSTSAFGAIITLQAAASLVTKSFRQTFTSSSGATLDTWNHIAYSRIGVNYYLFLNGYQIASIANTFPLVVGRILRIGTAVWLSQASPPSLPLEVENLSPAIGYMDDLRITKGVARYFDDFTPPISQHPDPEL